MGPTKFEKVKNAEAMFGTGSRKHLKMLRTLCTCPCSRGEFCGGCTHAGCGTQR